MASLTDGEIERLVENAWRYTPDRMAAYLTRNEEVIEGFGALTTEGGFALAGPYQRPRHVRYLGKTIARAIAQGGGRIVINQPPQTGKSQLVSKWTPTWAQKVTHGRARVLLGSYESSFAATWGRAVRDTVGRYSHELEVKLAKDVTARDEWLTTVGGGMITAGVGTGLTGKPGDIIIVDDPHKDFKDAHSPTKRKDVWNWFNSVVMTRVQPGTTVIVIHCLTGDTRVLMADGTEKPLRDVRPGDGVATYEDGALSSSTVVNWANQGSDAIYAITMRSGTVVRANARHPFLTIEEGVEVWRRTAELEPGQQIVRVTGRTEESPAPGMDATGQPSARACACPTTTRPGGPRATGLRRSTQRHDGMPTSSTATASRERNTISSWLSKAASALSVASRRRVRTLAPTGTASSASTTTTTPARCEACCATTATSPSATASLLRSCALPLATWSATPDEIVSIVPAGTEDVFDIQVARTENFIANGLVSHNTRWHEEDLTGHIFNSPGAEQWTHIRLPAICDAPDDPLGRAIGESIWPERFDEAHYDMVKTSQGLYIWSGMYQQRPSPLEGSIFKKADWRFVDVAPERMLVERNWDFAGTEGAGDWTVGVLLGRHEGHTFILDVFRDQIGDADTERVLLEVARADRDRYGDRYRVRGEQEPGSAGKKLAASYTRLLAGYDVKFETSTGDKVLRARPLAAQQQAGNVSLVRELRDGTYREPSWWAEFIEEFAVFPNNAHDDQVDATSLGFTHLVEDERQPSKVRMSSAAGIRIEPGRPSGRRLPGT